MARRQEQEDAREEITELAPNVLRMELPIRMPGLGHVNCYALIDDDGCALVDPGLPGPQSFKALEKRLKQAGLAVRNVHTVFITHSHPDHFGGAARLAKEAGAKIVAHKNFHIGPIEAAQPEVSVEDLEAQRASELEEARQRGELPLEPPEEAVRRTHKPVATCGETPWGGARPKPPWHLRIKWGLIRRFTGKMPWPVVSQRVEHQQVLRLAKREWFVFHTPGHTEDHICLHSPEEGLYLSGDHVLPSITPHISGIARSPDPLADFYASLDAVGAVAGVSKVFPAHGHPFDDLPARCEAIKRHHDERLDKVVEIGHTIGRAATVPEYSEHLFQKRNWGPMADSETYAHLEHLRIVGRAECHLDAKGMLVYTT